MNRIFQLMAEREQTTLNLEKALQEAADLHKKSMEVVQKLRKALHQQGFVDRILPHSMDSGHVLDRNTGFFNALIGGTRAESLIDEAVKEHAVIRAKICKAGVA
ncbi:MAG: hypothetical protein VB050_13230 [Geobacteraceae bacterium]|nr:hypothetical protein [Geobacteraceae bacterium]